MFGTTAVADSQTIRPTVCNHCSALRAVSFGIDPQRYDAVRPGYPPEVVERLTGGCAATVLDVGAGTGLAGRSFAEVGCEVLAVEPDPRMAEVAREAGLDVEVSRFEEWEPGERRFDVAVCAQAWWWLDREVALTKCAAVLVPGGRLGVVWNAGGVLDPLTLALSEVYERVGRGKLREPMLPGGLSPDVQGDLEADDRFAKVALERFEWERRYPCDDWLAAACTFGDVIGADTETRAALLREVRAAIDQHGGYRDVAVITTLVTAVRR